MLKANVIFSFVKTVMTTFCRHFPALQTARIVTSKLYVSSCYFLVP